MIDLYRDWYWSNLLSSWESSVELCVYLSTFNNITEKCHTRNQMLVRKSWKYCIHIRCMIVTNWQRSVRGKFSTEGINLILIDSTKSLHYDLWLFCRRSFFESLFCSFLLYIWALIWRSKLSHFIYCQQCDSRWTEEEGVKMDFKCVYIVITSCCYSHNH